MNEKILGGLALAVVVLVGGYFVFKGLDGVDQVSGVPVIPHSSPALVWAFDPAGTDTNDAPLTSVSLLWNGKTYDAGTWQGTCSTIEGSKWERMPGEESGVICWWAGGGTELGVFSEDGEKVVKEGLLDEGSAEEPGTRGDFTTRFVLKDESDSVLLKAGINNGASGFGVRITPLSIVEDSRCPANAQCIQAGTVRVNARVDIGPNSHEEVFTLGIVTTLENQTVTLVSVEPAKMVSKTIAPSEYRFTFGVEKRTK